MTQNDSHLKVLQLVTRKPVAPTDEDTPLKQNSLSVQELLDRLSPERLRTMATLADTGDDYRRAVLATLPDGFQALLVELGLAREAPGGAYELTALGLRVAEAAHQEEDPSASVPDDLSEQVAALQRRLTDVELPFEAVATLDQSEVSAC